jgi:hypothetical protein
MIIWGSKAKAKQVGSGIFFCPNCVAESPYSLVRFSRYFTLYFIPLFPTATLGQYVQCRICGQQLPEVVLTCSRDEIRKAIEPWDCPKCNNRNSRAETKCLSCGSANSQPPPIPGQPPRISEALPPRMPSASPFCPPIIPTREPMGILAKVLIASGCVFALLVIAPIVLWVILALVMPTTPRTPTDRSFLYEATAKIGPSGESTSGNSAEAVRLAEKLVSAMTSIRREHFTESGSQALVDQRDTFKVYCDLRSNQCVFLIHVPELRRFQGQAQTSLGTYAWNAARAVLKEGGVEDSKLRLAVALRGLIAYERVMLGDFTPEGTDGEQGPSEVEEGFGCEKRLVGWFTPSVPESAPLDAANP